MRVRTFRGYFHALAFLLGGLGVILMSYAPLVGLPISGLALAFVLCGALMDPNFSLLLLFGSFVSIDPIRRILSSSTEQWSYLSLLAIDALVALTLLSILIHHSTASRAGVRRPLLNAPKLLAIFLL